MRLSKKKQFSFLLILLFLIVFHLEAAVHLNLGERVSIPQIGLSMKLFKNSESRPLPLPASYQTKSSNTKVYKSDDVWRYRQYVGKWGNEYSEITVSLMQALSSTIHSKFITEGQLQGKFESELPTINWSDKKVDDWLKTYYGFSSFDFNREITIGANLKAKIYFIKKGNEPSYQYILAIVPEKRRIRQNVLFLYRLSKEIQMKKALGGVVSLLKSIRYIRLEKESNNLNYLNKSALKNDKKTEKFTREFILQNIKNLKDWKAVFATNYYILTNCTDSSDSNSFIQSVADALESDRRVYEAFYKEKVPCKDKFIVRIFKDRDDYVAYVGKEAEWTGGLWVPSRKELVLFKPKFTSSGKDEFYKTLKHEAFHQYLHYAVGGVQTGAWFNEGNAVFMENVERKGRKIHIKPDANRLKYIKKHLADSDLSKRVSDLLKKSYKEFYATNSASANYNLSWAIIYFLYTGTLDTYRKFHRNYSKILPQYYDGLYLYKDDKKAFQNAWKRFNIRRFTESMVYYYKNKVYKSKVTTRNY